jgi:hypothetical protein
MNEPSPIQSSVEEQPKIEIIRAVAPSVTCYFPTTVIIENIPFGSETCYFPTTVIIGSIPFGTKKAQVLLAISGWSLSSHGVDEESHKVLAFAIFSFRDDASMVTKTLNYSTRIGGQLLRNLMLDEYNRRKQSTNGSKLCGKILTPLDELLSEAFETNGWPATNERPTKDKWLRKPAIKKGRNAPNISLDLPLNSFTRTQEAPFSWLQPCLKLAQHWILERYKLPKHIQRLEWACVS